MKRLILIGLVLLAVGCWSVPPNAQDATGDGYYTWYYVDGPHGEHCLVMHSGSGQSQSDAMDCDEVKP